MWQPRDFVQSIKISHPKGRSKISRDCIFRNLTSPIVFTQISQLDVRLSDHVTAYHAQSLRIDEVSELLITTLDTLERVESGTLVISRPEIVQIRKEITDMEALLVSLKQNHSATVVIQDLQREVRKEERGWGGGAMVGTT